MHASSATPPVQRLPSSEHALSYQAAASDQAATLTLRTKMTGADGAGPCPDHHTKDIMHGKVSQRSMRLASPTTSVQRPDRQNPVKCGWSAPALEAERLPSTAEQRQLLLMADQDLARLTQPGAVAISNRLQEAYAQGLAISMPGARQALADARQLVLSLYDTPGISAQDQTYLGLLKAWIADANHCGCLHDTTEQICFCLSLVRLYFSRRYESDQLGQGKQPIFEEIPPHVSLGDILAMPWALYQSEYDTFYQTYHRLGLKTYSHINSRCNDLVWASRWPRLCTFQVLDIDYFVALMGQKVLVVGFFKSSWEILDQRIYTSNTMPRHDLVHAKFMVDYWLDLSFLLAKRNNKQLFSNEQAHYTVITARKAAYMRKQPPTQEIGTEACQVMTHMARATERLQQHLARLSTTDRTLCSLILFEFYHETNVTIAFPQWTRSFVKTAGWQGSRVVHNIVSDLQRYALKKYNCGAVTEESKRIQTAFNSIPETYRKIVLEGTERTEQLQWTEQLQGVKDDLPAGICVAQAFIEEVRDSFLEGRAFNSQCLPSHGIPLFWLTVPSFLLPEEYRRFGTKYECPPDQHSESFASYQV